MSGFLYNQAGELYVQKVIQVLVYQNSPFLILMCVLCIRHLLCKHSELSLIEVKSLDKETLCLCLPAGISSREGLTEIVTAGNG